MPTFDAASAECLVFTFKEGLLSRVAHDLKIRVTAFEVEVAEDLSSVSARFDATSLRVSTAMVEGREAPDKLSAKDKGKIEKHIVEDVIPTRRHPEVRFRSSAIDVDEGVHRVRGELDLAGARREVSLEAREVVEGLIAEARIDQRDFGITPFSAMLGSLKIKPEIRVRLQIPFKR